MIFDENCLLVDNSYEISSRIVLEIRKDIPICVVKIVLFPYHAGLGNALF